MKLGVEKSGVEMSFNRGSTSEDNFFGCQDIYNIILDPPKNFKFQNSYFALYLWTNKSQNGYSGRASSPDGGDAAGALAWRFEFGTPVIAAAEPARQQQQ